MTIRKFLLDPKMNFEYVSDSVLWDNVFQNPFPVDLRYPEEECVILSRYFEVRACFIDSRRGYKIERKLLKPQNMFFESTELVKIRAFVCLSNFLNKFNRPFRDCALYIPNHPDIKPKKEYSPISLYSNTPVFPTLNDEGNMIRIYLNHKTFNKLCWYSFKKTTYRGGNSYLDFPCGCFWGFVLQY